MTLDRRQGGKPPPRVFAPTEKCADSPWYAGHRVTSKQSRSCSKSYISPAIVLITGRPARLVKLRAAATIGLTDDDTLLAPVFRFDDELATFLLGFFAELE